MRKTASSLQEPGFSSGTGWERAQHSEMSSAYCLHVSAAGLPTPRGLLRPNRFPYASPGHRNTAGGLRGRALLPEA